VRRDKARSDEIVNFIIFFTVFILAGLIGPVIDIQYMDPLISALYGRDTSGMTSTASFVQGAAAWWIASK